MKTFQPKTQRAVLRAMIRGWWVTCRPSIAKAVLLKDRFFSDEKYRVVVRALLLRHGDLTAVKSDFQKNPQPWHAKFFAWAEKVKGGAL